MNKNTILLILGVLLFYCVICSILTERIEFILAQKEHTHEK